MFRTIDLVAVTVGTDDVASAVETFRKSFGFEVKREPKGERVSLRIGPGEIEMIPAPGAGGLQAIVLAVDGLANAERDLRARGFTVSRGDHQGRPALVVGPEGTHGTPIVLIESDVRR
jgi:hypothetical protein